MAHTPSEARYPVLLECSGRHGGGLLRARASTGARPRVLVGRRARASTAPHTQARTHAARCGGTTHGQGAPGWHQPWGTRAAVDRVAPRRRARRRLSRLSRISRPYNTQLEHPPSSPSTCRSLRHFSDRPASDAGRAPPRPAGRRSCSAAQCDRIPSGGPGAGGRAGAGRPLQAVPAACCAGGWRVRLQRSWLMALDCI